MDEMQVIKELDGNSYRLYKYLTQRARDCNIWDIKREQIEEDLRLSINTIYKIIKDLESKGYIKYHGQKNYCKILK